MTRPFSGRARLTAAVAAAATLVGVGLAAGPGAAADTAGATKTYIALYREGASTSGAAAAVRAAGGSMVARYDQIGVVVARSDRTGFAADLKGVAGVVGVAATDGLGVRSEGVQDTAADSAAGSGATAASTEPLSGLQWDMDQIDAPAAHAVSTGSRDVLVADLDTGLDFTHPDLAPNYDAANSADCSSGAPAPLQVGNDKNGHGTHTAGTIAAAVNGIGIAGVAPGVRIAGIKTSNDDGFFFPEMVVCAFMWAGTHGVDVTNNSYFADPWLFNCRNDADQRAIWEAERRAIRFAQSRGTLVVASEGNESTDLSHPRVDVVSPDYPPGNDEERAITNACAVVPVEVPGVIGVTATGPTGLKSFYSSYGASTADVAAPGGDSLADVRGGTVNGRVLSTWPASLPCGRPVIDGGAHYCYLQGTSMAGPHVAGVAALALSTHPGLTAGGLAALVQRATDPQDCPASVTRYEPFPQSDGSPQACTGGSGHTSWYGSGVVNARKAVG